MNFVLSSMQIYMLIFSQVACCVYSVEFNLHHLCSDNSAGILYCSFDGKGLYSYSQTTVNLEVRRISFDRLTNSRINLYGLPNVAMISIQYSTSDSLAPCEHIFNNKLPVTIFNGETSTTIACSPDVTTATWTTAARDTTEPEMTSTSAETSETTTTEDYQTQSSVAHVTFKPATDNTTPGQRWHFEDAISAVCTSSGWNISMDMSILRQLYPNIAADDIYLSPGKCHGTTYNNKLWFRQGFDTCMTTKKDVGATTLFQNILFYVVFDPVDQNIVRRHFWTYNVACYLPKQESASAHLHHNVESHSSNITGHREITLTFFKDPNFQQKITGNPLRVSIGDNVYVNVATSIPDWNTKMRLHTCYTRPSDRADDHLLIRDGCEVDSSTHIISQSTHATIFVFQDFEYLTFNEGLDIFCNATFCNSTDYSPSCTQACRQGPSLVG